MNNNAAAAFIGIMRPGFIYVFPAASGGDPETLYFVSEAEEYVEELLES